MVQETTMGPAEKALREWLDSVRPGLLPTERWTVNCGRRHGRIPIAAGNALYFTTDLTADPRCSTYRPKSNIRPTP